MAMRSCRGGWRVRRPPQSSSSPAGPDPKRPRSFFPVIRSRGNPVIRNAVRIGREAVVMPSVTIGDGAIIAARARSRPGCRPVPRSEAILPGLEEAVQRRGRRPVAAPRGGCALRSKDAPNILYGPLGIMIPYRRTSIQNGGYLKSSVDNAWWAGISAAFSRTFARHSASHYRSASPRGRPASQHRLAGGSQVAARGSNRGNIPRRRGHIMLEEARDMRQMRLVRE